MIDTILSLETYITEFTSWTKNNPVVGGVIGIWLLGVLSYTARKIPNTIKQLVIKYFTITVNIHNQDEIFVNAVKWFEKNDIYKKARTLRIHNGRNGWSDEITIGPGYGDFYFWHKKKLFKLNRAKEDSTGSHNHKEVINISTIGRSQDRILDLISEFDKNKDRVETEIYKWSPEWSLYQSQTPRSLDSVVIESSTKSRVVSHIENFIKRREWYKNCGIPFRTGLLLSGVPGTGKTSFVLGLAEKFNQPIYLINLSTVSDSSLLSAMSSVPSNAIVLLEDIDTFGVTQERKKLDTKDSTQESEKTEFLTLSGLLNAIDGIISSDGRILVMTTNHKDKIDSALLRPGRIDLSVELKHLNDETFRLMFNRFYDEELPKEAKIKSGITPAKFQSLVLENLVSPETLLENVLDA